VTVAELFTLISEKPSGVVGIVVANQQHARVVRDALLHYAIDSTIRAIYSRRHLSIGDVGVFFITRPKQLLGMQFDLILVYTYPSLLDFLDSELRVRIKPDAWVKSVVRLQEEQ